METAAMARVMKEEPTLSQVNMTKVIEATATDLQIELVQDYDTFLGLEPVWNGLVAESGIDFPFVRHEWVRMVWNCFKAEGCLYIVLVKDKSKAVALAPLWPWIRWTHGPVVVRTVSSVNVMVSSEPSWRLALR